MTRWWLLGMAILLPLVRGGGTVQAAAEDTTATTPELEMQVRALTAVEDLDLTSRQIHELKSMCSETQGEAPTASEEKADASYHAALLGLRDALATGDDDKIGDAEDKVDDLREKLEIDPNAMEVHATDAAKKKSGIALKMLSTSQIANYISMHSGDIPDAYDTIMDAIDQCKNGTDADFASLKDEAADQVALLAGGMEQTATSTIGKKVSDLLDTAHKMDDPSKHQSELEKQAHDITKSVDSFTAMRHWMLREMADMLSNPQIGKALDLRLSEASKNKSTD